MMSDEAMTSMEPNTYGVFFHENQIGHCRPRCVLTDTEPLVIDDVLRSKHGNFYAPSQTICGERSAAFHTAGLYTLGKLLIDDIMDGIRHQVEMCDNFDGFMLFYSSAGGTGSGLTSLLAQRCEDYQKKE